MILNQLINHSFANMYLSKQPTVGEAMGEFDSFMHNPFSTKFQSELMMVCSCIFQSRNAKYNSTRGKDYSIIQELSKTLEPFKNRIKLEKTGIKHFLEDLKKKVKEDKGCLIGEIIFCCDELSDKPLEMQTFGTSGVRGGDNESHSIFPPQPIDTPHDILITKYTTPKRTEIEITFKSICRSFIRDMFKNFDDVDVECRKMINRIITEEC